MHDRALANGRETYLLGIIARFERTGGNGDAEAQVRFICALACARARECACMCVAVWQGNEGRGGEVLGT